MYRIKRTIPLGCRLYVFDIDCSPDGFLCLSAINIRDYKTKSESILFTSLYGRYIALQERDKKKEYIYSTEATVSKKLGSPTPFPPIDINIWPLSAKKLHPEHTAKCTYTPQGVAVSRTGDILIYCGIMRSMKKV